jgi:hypothetical protein
VSRRQEKLGGGRADQLSLKGCAESYVGQMQLFGLGMQREAFTRIPPSSLTSPHPGRHPTKESPRQGPEVAESKSEGVRDAPHDSSGSS